MARSRRGAWVAAYSVVMMVAVQLARPLARWVFPLRRQLNGRFDYAQGLVSWAKDRDNYPRAAIFFCSSAGEYEQAKPLLERLRQRGDVYLHIFFFSQSGMDYAKARRESIPYALSPPDLLATWDRVFSALRPTLTCVVRHELWPAFLEVAQRYGQLYLVDAVIRRERRETRTRQRMRAFFFTYFHHIFTVGAEDKDILVRTYGLSSEMVSVTGDTKYDRVVERTAANHDEALRTCAPIRRLSSGRLNLIVGSAHRPDIEAILKARRTLGPDAGRWFLIIAPHDVDEAMVGWIEEKVQQEGLTSARYTRIVPGDPAAPAVEVLIVDTMGKLSEVYAAGVAAFVGGAMHHQVHNVLEPASHGLNLAFGPFHTNSEEAKHLVRHRLARVCVDASQISTWWSAMTFQDAQGCALVLSEIKQLTGAADQIVGSWAPLFEGVSHG